MSLNLTIEDTSFQSEVAGEKCRNYPPLPLLYSLMLNLVEGFSIGCYSPFSGSRFYQFSESDRPLDKVLIEYYTSALGPELAMFAKMKARPTLVETYEEAERVEAEKEV